MRILKPERQKQLQKLLEALGITELKAINWYFLDLALTHPSMSQIANYQQLEFVGDAVVRLAASELLLETYPDATVGEFAAIRSILVSDRTLAQFAENYDLDQYLLMTNNAANDQGGKISRLAETFEAVLGALYLSNNNMSLVRPWLDSCLKQQAEEIRACPARQNYKDALQEWSQAHHKLLPKYQIKEFKKASENERFEAKVLLEDRLLGKGKGRSKKEAEQAAAKDAYLKFVTL
jgi:ribonuclease III